MSLNYHENLKFENNLSISNLNINNDSEQKMFRCPKCRTFPVINSVVQTKMNEYILLYECKCIEPNKYVRNDPINFYLTFTEMEKIHCNNCNEKNNLLFSTLDNNIIYCQKCANIKKVNLNNFRTLEDIDSICEIHNLKFIGYDSILKINICEGCMNDNICIDPDLKLFNEIKKKFEIENVKKKINDINDKIFNKDIQVHKNILNTKNISDNDRKKINEIFEKNKNENQNLFKIIEIYYKNFIKINEKDKLNFELIKSYLIITKNLIVKNEYNENSYEINKYINYLNNNIIILTFEGFDFAEKDEYKNIDEQKNDYNDNSLNNNENNYLCINNLDDTQSLGDYTRIKLITNERKDLVSNIILLHDGRYAISIGNNIDIVDSNNYNIDITLKGHKKEIFYIFQINEQKHRLITASFDMSIMLWIFNKTQFQNEGIIKGHTSIIFKVIQFNTNYIVSSSMSEIKLWKIDFPFTNLHTLPQQEGIYSLCESNNYLFFASERNDLCCYKLLNEKLELIESFKNIKAKSNNDIININENLIAIGESEKVTLIDTKLLKIYKIISVSSTKSTVFSLCYFKENRLLVGMSNCIKEFNIETCEELGSIEMNENNEIISINKLNNDRFSSCGIKNSFGCIWGKK